MLNVLCTYGKIVKWSIYYSLIFGGCYILNLSKSALCITTGPYIVNYNNWCTEHSLLKILAVLFVVI